MGNNLEKIRGQHQISQTELARKIGVSRQEISRFEKGTRKIGLKMALKIAEALNENVFDILGSDVLLTLPETDADKKIIIEMIKEL